MNIDEVVGNFETKRRAINEWFIERERDIVHDIMRKIDSEFRIANSIFPSASTPAGKQEYIERRLHINNAIAHCHELMGEFQYILTALPVDKNKYCNLEEAITKQIEMFKGIRKADNRFLKQIKDEIKNNKN